MGCYEIFIREGSTGLCKQSENSERDVQPGKVIIVNKFIFCVFFGYAKF